MLIIKILDEKGQEKNLHFTDMPLESILSASDVTNYLWQNFVQHIDFEPDILNLIRNP